MVRECPGRPPNKTIFFSTSTRFFDFSQKSQHPFLAHLWRFCQFGRLRLNSHDNFAPVMLIYVAGSYIWTQNGTIFDFHFELQLRATPSPMHEKLSKPFSCILIHHASSCIIMMIIINDSWPRNTVNNAWLCITMHHGQQSWCIIMYHDDHEPSTSPCSTFRAQGWFRAKKQNRNSHILGERCFHW